MECGCFVVDICICWGGGSSSGDNFGIRMYTCRLRRLIGKEVSIVGSTSTDDDVVSPLVIVLWAPP